MTVDLLPPPAEDRSIPVASGKWQHETRWPEFSTRWVVLGALVAVALRLPYLRSPLRSDEGGFLLVGSQWHPGSSLYGNYWVDRPPLLVGFYAAADWLGGATALRLMGCGLVFAVILLAHHLGRSVTRVLSPWPTVLALALVAMPFAGALEVNGELIAAPLVLLGLVAALRAVDEREVSRLWRLWVAVGALGAAAAMVKQNFLDVLVFSAALILVRTWTDQATAGRLRRGSAELAALSAGALAAAAAVVLGAWTRGTTPAGLWDAIVVFRFEASRVIADSASAATDVRLRYLLLAMCLSGSVALVLVFAAHAARRWREPLVMATAALLAWELFGVLAGGSYWLHYLVGLVPGLVLVVAIMDSRAGLLGRAARTIVSYTAVAALVTAPAALLLTPPSHELPLVASWLRHHAQPGDTATLLYGAPDILQAAGLSSPYAQLWSLPIRVRDPDLAQLESVLRGPDAPTWLLASHDLATWGVSAGPAFAVVTARYEPVATVDGYTVYHLHPTDHPNQESS
jgi:hypothetical protein